MAKVEKKKKRQRPILSNSIALASKRKMKGKKIKKVASDVRRRKFGPHLPSSFMKEMGIQKPSPNSSDLTGGEEEEEGEDLYEYEEAIPEEETGKNRRYDAVENYEYELPEEFEDEDVPSDENDDVSVDDGDDAGVDEEEEGEDAGEKHVRMLQSITGLPAEAFEGKGKKNVTLLDVHGDMGPQHVSIYDFLDPLHGKSGYSKLRKRVHQLEREPMAVSAPLPKVEREKLEREVTYAQSKKEITKWEPLVKRNREAPTLLFNEDLDLAVPTVGAIAAEHRPRTEFEKKMAVLLGDPEVLEAHTKDGAKLLELNKISVKDVLDRHNHLAKMRSLFFRHEMKSKHIKKIKSKTYHRILKRGRQKGASAEINMDPEAANELARKQEFKRAEERMTLKHKNSSKWAKRIIKRGLKAQDEGTRAAIAEQLQQHALLTRKMNSMIENSSSDETSDDDSDDFSPGSDREGVSKLLNKAKEKTIKVMEEEEDMPKSGVLSLPFMERSVKRQREAAREEALLALQEYEASLGKHDEKGDEKVPSTAQTSGKRVFGGAKSQPKELSRKPKSPYNSDSESDFEARDGEEEQKIEDRSQQAKIGSLLLPDEALAAQNKICEDLDDIAKIPASKTTYEVAIFASDTWRKIGSENSQDNVKIEPSAAESPVHPNSDNMVHDGNSDSDSETEMVDGFISSVPKSEYELPSQSELIRRAFAADDVEAEFEKDKMDTLNAENHEPEKPALLPGWGQWTHIQQKKGIPSSMIEKHEDEIKKREEALKRRKDANLKNIIISEKIDRKAEKLHAKSLPFPYTSKEVYEQSIRMPIGPDYNPAISIGALNRPAIVKRAGVIVKPIVYEEIDPCSKLDEPKESKKIRQKQNRKKAKVDGRKFAVKS
ncbi:hypothetical protein AXF42_Ash013927 [Apostasia shenzhenica]|uniref:U3 small nucleolar RNA-associated protein 14 n=1 Tax=Apostasia shenzhenica TaxID=1088818 RepID=A0A2I0AS94_9ASPA|nr:hypothetical protein AXF42_Ash013927 [Apostasia shenzhenica]